MAKNVKKTAPAVKKLAKTYTDNQICKVALMVFKCESEVARINAAVELFLSDEINKNTLLTELMAVDRNMRSYSKSFHQEIDSIIGHPVTENLKDGK